MLVIAVANQKGGVGKTTTGYHLAVATREFIEGKILILDLDPQGNMTTVTVDPDPGVTEDQAGVADVLSARSELTLSDVIVAGRWEQVDVAPTPSTEELAAVRDELVISGPGRERRLKEALDSVADQYEVCFIDCPPSLDQLTVNAFAAADRILIITHAKLFSSDGLGALLRTIDSVRAYYNPDLKVGGALINHLEERTVSARHWRDQLAESAAEHGFEVLSPPIPKRAPVSDACESGTSLAEWGPDGRELLDIYIQHATTLVKGAL